MSAPISFESKLLRESIDARAALPGENKSSVLAQIASEIGYTTRSIENALLGRGSRKLVELLAKKLNIALSDLRITPRADQRSARRQTGGSVREALRPTSLSTILANIGSLKHQAVLRMESVLGSSFMAVDGLILFWWDCDHLGGLRKSELLVHPKWNHQVQPQLGMAQHPLQPLHAELAAWLRRFRTTPSPEPSTWNRPKVRLVNWSLPLSDRPGMSMTFGALDFETSLAHTSALTQSGPIPISGESFLHKYEHREFDIREDLFGHVVTHVVAITADNHLVVLQRPRGNTVDFAQGQYSPSCEEGLDPSRENHPHDAAIRGVLEELHVEVREQDVRLVGFGREWGEFWNTALVYVVNLAVPSDELNHRWSGAGDRTEATGLALIPLGDGRACLHVLQILREGCSVQALAGLGASLYGHFSDGRLHQTTGEARLVLGFLNWFGSSVLDAIAS